MPSWSQLNLVVNKAYSGKHSLFTLKPEPSNSKSQLVYPCPQLSKEGSQLYSVFKCLISRFAHLFLLALYQDIIEGNKKRKYKESSAEFRHAQHSHNSILHQGISLLLL